MQYNTAVDQVVTNLRLNFVHSPLSDLVVVYTERRGIAGAGFIERALTAKITKLLAF